MVIFLMSVYFPLSVRFVRARVLEAEAKLTELLPGGEADYHEAFGSTVSHRGQILVVIAIALLAIYFIAISNTMTDRVIIAICTVYIATMLGSLVWLYSAALSVYTGWEENPSSLGPSGRIQDWGPANRALRLLVGAYSIGGLCCCCFRFFPRINIILILIQ
jgi:hypothetical protein